MTVVDSPVTFSFSPHARERMAEMGLHKRDVRRAIKEAPLSYPGRLTSDGSSTRVYVGRGLAVVTRDDKPLVITVLWDGKEGR